MTTIPHSSEGALRLLGRNFWPSVDKKEIEKEVLKQFEDVMDKISKSNILTTLGYIWYNTLFMLFYPRWHLTIYPISVSWIDLNSTRLMTQYINKWSGIMMKASPEILYISKQQGGLGFPDLTSVLKWTILAFKCDRRRSTATSRWSSLGSIVGSQFSSSELGNR
jgi:hypothetical protein